MQCLYSRRKKPTSATLYRAEEAKAKAKERKQAKRAKLVKAYGRTRPISTEEMGEKRREKRTRKGKGRERVDIVTRSTKIKHSVAAANQQYTSNPSF
jgi:hypothetical protein